MRPTHWLVAANVLFVLGGVIAYATAVGPGLMAVLAFVVALPGLMDLRSAAGDAGRIWFDRALSYAVGAWAVAAVLIVLPYITVEESTALWSSRPYAALGVAVGSVGMLLWNAMAARGQGADPKAMRLYILLHAFLIAVAVWFVMQGDGMAVAYDVRGFAADGIDLQYAPVLAAVPGAVWALLYVQRSNDPST